MDANLYLESIQYEQLTQAIYQAILQSEGITNIEVQHNVGVTGRSGVEHQIDVLWKFKQAGVEHKVLIECKNFASALTLEKVRNFFAVIHDIGNAQGLVVTKTGFQSGAVRFANYYGVGLKLLRKPIESDWENRIRDINIEITAKTIASSPEKRLSVGVVVDAINEDQKERLKVLEESGTLNILPVPELCFLDASGSPISEELKWWLPKNIDTIDKEDGGPYNQVITLDDHYIYINEGTENQELIRIKGLKVTYFVESYSMESIIYGEDIVAAILKDFNTGEVEHVQHNT